MPVTWMPKVDWLSQEGKLREQLDAEWAKIQAELRSRRTLQLPSRPTELPFEATSSLSTTPTTTTPTMPAWFKASPSTAMPTFNTPRYMPPPSTVLPWQPQESQPLQLIEPMPTQPLTPRRQRQTILEQPPITPKVEAPKETVTQKPVAFWRRALQVFAKPFEFIQGNIINPAEALVGTGLGIVPEVERLHGEDFWAWKKRSWSGWETPGVNIKIPILGKVKLDVKFVLENAPWLLIPGAGEAGTAARAGTGLAGFLGKAGAVGRVAGKAVEYSPWGLAEKTAGAAIKGAVRKTEVITSKVSTAVGEKVFGKYVPPPIPPEVIKLTKYTQDVVSPAFKEFQKAKSPLRKGQAGRLEEVRAQYNRGDITEEEYNRLSKLAKSGAVKPEYNLTPKALATRQAKDFADVQTNLANGEISEATSKMLITKIKNDPAYAIVNWSQEEAKGLSDMILRSSERGFMADDSRDALLAMLMGEAKELPQPHHIRDWSKVFGEDFAKVAAKIIGNKEVYGGGFVDTLNIARSLQSSIDLSATLRQGLILSLLHPTQVPVWFGRQVKALVSEKLALEADDAMRAHPLFNKFEKLGGFTAQLRGATARTSEELFPSRVARMLPGMRRSERAFVTYTNQARFAAFKDAYGAMVAQGASEGQLKLMTRFINLSSGRGEIPKSLEEFTPALNAILFSPRLQASTLQLPRQLGRMLLSDNPYMRKEAAKALVTFVGGGASILGLLKMYGHKVELDPRSVDFAKIKIRDTRLDIWRGYVQYARFAGTMLTGERKSAFGKMSDAKRSETAWRFLQSKGSPAFGMMVDLLRNETYEGKPIFNDTTGFVKAVRGRILPLALQDIMDAMEQGGINQVWTAAPAELGIGTLTYVNDYVKVKAKIAKELGYESWDDIDPMTQRQIENRSGELQAATIAFDRQVMGTAFGDWRLAGNAVEDTFRQNVDLAVAKYQKDGDGVAFRNKVSDAFTARRGGYDAREKEPRFADIVARRQTTDTMESLVSLGAEQMAIKTYDDALYGKDMFDEFGDYRFDEADIRKEELKQSMGDELFKYVEDYLNIRYETYPLEFQELAKAKKVMKPYWDVRNDVIRVFKSETFVDTPRGQRLIAKLRKRLRMSDPDIEKYYQMFYANTK